MGERGYLVHDSYTVQVTTYEIENRNPKAVNLMIEHNRSFDGELFDAPDPVAKTAEFYRWMVPVAASTQTRFVVQERHLRVRKERITSLNARIFQEYLQNKFIDDRFFQGLVTILDLSKSVENLRKSVERHWEILNKLAQEQKETAEKMQPLGRDDEEGQLRRRLVAKIQLLEDDRDRMMGEINRWQADLQDLEAQINQEIQKLTPTST